MKNYEQHQQVVIVSSPALVGFNEVYEVGTDKPETSGKNLKNNLNCVIIREMSSRSSLISCKIVKSS